MGSMAGWGPRIGDGVYSRMGTQDRCRVYGRMETQDRCRGLWQDGDPGYGAGVCGRMGTQDRCRGLWQDFINLADLCCLFLPVQHLFQLCSMCVDSVLVWKGFPGVTLSDTGKCLTLGNVQLLYLMIKLLLQCLKHWLVLFSLALWTSIDCCSCL